MIAGMSGSFNLCVKLHHTHTVKHHIAETKFRLETGEISHGRASVPPCHLEDRCSLCILVVTIRGVQRLTGLHVLHDVLAARGRALRTQSSINQDGAFSLNSCLIFKCEKTDILAACSDKLLSEENTNDRIQGTENT